jgi:hypothetical protein
MRVIEKSSLMAARCNRPRPYVSAVYYIKWGQRRRPAHADPSRRASSPVPSGLAMDFTDDGPHHVEASTSESRASAPVASTPQDGGAERRIVAPITRTRFQGMPP